MNPFSQYVDCINCGNELGNVSELTFHTPDKVECDFCGQIYNDLSVRIKRTKRIVSTIFLILAVSLFYGAWRHSGFASALFALFPLLIVYYFSLGYAVRKAIRF